MKDYVQYHQYSTQRDWNHSPIVYSKKKINCVVGDRIWLIGGKKQSDIYRYYLVKVFYFSHRYQEGNWWIYAGKNIIYNECDIEITNMEWFPPLFDKIGRGAFGISKVPDQYIAFLESIITK